LADQNIKTAGSRQSAAALEVSASLAGCQFRDAHVAQDIWHREIPKPCPSASGGEMIAVETI